MYGHNGMASVLWQKWATQRAHLQPDWPRSFGGGGVGGGHVAAQRPRCAPRAPVPPRLGSDSLGLVKGVAVRADLRVTSQRLYA